mmetsp:Transcript_136634/g.436584  ORF Transcript_136634/g.436584 Transcript_136634/m.436584 type:complete len:163 (-) Transcript_136634:101-589(-)
MPLLPVHEQFQQQEPSASSKSGPPAAPRRRPEVDQVVEMTGVSESAAAAALEATAWCVQAAVEKVLATPPPSARGHDHVPGLDDLHATEQHPTGQGGGPVLSSQAPSARDAAGHGLTPAQREKVVNMMEISQCTEDQASIALLESEWDENEALQRLLAGTPR